MPVAHSSISKVKNDVKRDVISHVTSHDVTSYDALSVNNSLLVMHAKGNVILKVLLQYYIVEGH